MESKSTHFHRKNLSSKHHIDYAFIPAIYLDDCKFSIGSIDKYLNHSDHLPIFIQLHNLKSQLLTEENYNGKTDLLK